MWDELLTPIEEVAEHMHVWAVGELEGGGLAPISYEVTGAARDLADLLGHSHDARDDLARARRKEQFGKDPKGPGHDLDIFGV